MSNALDYLKRIAYEALTVIKMDKYTHLVGSGTRDFLAELSRQNCLDESAWEGHS